MIRLNNLSQDVYEYLISYILGTNDANIHKAIKYGNPSDDSLKNSRSIYIIPSGFFEDGRYLSRQSLPEQVIYYNDLPFLYGEEKVECINGNIIIHMDIIASAFFLMTRYEECIRREARDEHGRFIRKLSVINDKCIFDRPLIQEYGQFINKLLVSLGYRIKEEKQRINKIVITHDIDIPWVYSSCNILKNFKIFIKHTYKILLKKPNGYERNHIISSMLKDPNNTFPLFINNESRIKTKYGERYDTIYFIMPCKKGEYDEGYAENKWKLKKLLLMIRKTEAKLGIHFSYASGCDSKLLRREVENYRSILNDLPTISRHHYLMLREPEDMRELIQNGILDDYTMGFADGGGYRLGTCKPVRWIDPIEMKVTNLTLHPLLVTEGKILNKEYMSLSNEEAVKYLRNNLKMIKEYNGEFVILFHNHTVIDFYPYDIKRLYEDLISLLMEEDW